MRTVVRKVWQRAWTPILFATTLAGGLAIALAFWEAAALNVPLPDREICFDRRVTLMRGEPGFDACLERTAERFLKTEFAETKDVVKAFLSLLVAVFVGSIAFSEKIVDLNKTNWWARGAIIGSWLLVLTAIVLCGVGLALMTRAAGAASYEPERDFDGPRGLGLFLIALSGISFAIGLVAIFLAGLVALIERKQPNSGSEQREKHVAA